MVNQLFDTARLISTRDDFDTMLDTPNSKDLIDFALQRRSTTKFVFHQAVNMRVKVYPIHNQQLIGKKTDLPEFLKKSRSVMCLQDGNGKVFSKNDCAFRFALRELLSFCRRQYFLSMVRHLFVSFFPFFLN